MGETLALALAIALSPFPVVPAVLLLFTPRPRPTSLAFLGGWFTGIAAATGVFVLLSESVGSTGDSPVWMSWMRIVVGAALVAYGFRGWMTRHKSDDPPGWMTSIQDATPGTAVRLALLLSVPNPKIVVLAAAGGLDIGRADFSAFGDVVAVVVFTAVASMVVAIPVLGYALVGDRILPTLAKAKDWLLRNNAAVMAVVVTVIGFVLLRNGIAAL